MQNRSRERGMKGNVLLIGASGDIGIAIAKELAQDGYSLILHYNENKSSLADIRSSLEEERILMEIQADLKYEANIKRLLANIVFPVDHVVFAGGNADYGLFQDVPEERMDEMLALHVKAPWMITKHLLGPMIRKGSGSIILITSVWGEAGASNEVIYSSVKGAQNSFVKALAKELGPAGIQVNAVSPGFIDTKMNRHLLPEERTQIVEEIPLSRPGRPKDVAGAVSFLLSSKASYIQGQIIGVNGGWF